MCIRLSHQCLLKCRNYTTVTLGSMKISFQVLSAVNALRQRELMYLSRFIYQTIFNFYSCYVFLYSVNKIPIQALESPRIISGLLKRDYVILCPSPQDKAQISTFRGYREVVVAYSFSHILDSNSSLIENVQPPPKVQTTIRRLAWSSFCCLESTSGVTKRRWKPQDKILGKTAAKTWCQ